MEQEGRLPDRGLGILTNLIIHQDTITWTAFSIFSGFEFALFAILVQGQIRPDLVALLGLFLTFFSLTVTFRSSRYLDEYFQLARKRVSPDDLEIFDIKIPERMFRLPPAREALYAVDAVFAFAWLIVFVVAAV